MKVSVEVENTKWQIKGDPAKTNKNTNINKNKNKNEQKRKQNTNKNTKIVKEGFILS